jgi:putative membrane protein
MQVLFGIAMAGGPGGWGPGGAGGWGGPLWLLFPLFWLLVIGTIVWLVARNRRQESRSASAVEGATEILAARYARGEIDTDEYRQRHDALRELP